MKKVNLRDVPAESWTSPKGKYAATFQGISIALGRQPQSTDLLERHPFDVEMTSIPPGKSPFPYHSHSAQWEFYHIVSGTGEVRHEGGRTPVEAGDSFLFKPGEAHVLHNTGTEMLVYFTIADNPIGESCHYPDSDKHLVRSPEGKILRSENLDYFDGEE